MTKIALPMRVCADYWPAESEIKASNRVFPILVLDLVRLDEID